MDRESTTGRKPAIALALFRVSQRLNACRPALEGPLASGRTGTYRAQGIPMASMLETASMLEGSSRATRPSVGPHSGPTALSRSDLGSRHSAS
jgi:hypothetical protein